MTEEGNDDRAAATAAAAGAAASAIEVEDERSLAEDANPISD